MSSVNGAFTVRVDCPQSKIEGKLKGAIAAAQMVLDSSIQQSMWPFTPWKTGTMQTSLRGQGTGRLTYGVQYDRRTYYGLDTWNWTRTHHAQASPQWFERAKSIDEKKWNNAAQQALSRYLERGA